MSVETLSVTPLVLNARTAADLMTTNPQSLEQDVTLHEAVAWLVDRGVSGAPVIDEAGRPVGVFSRSDVLAHDREEVQHLNPPEIDYGTPLPRKWWEGFQLERVDTTRVRDLMTPAVFCVREGVPAWSVIEQLRELNVHRLFVVDDNGVLVGVITSLDVVRHLGPA